MLRGTPSQCAIEVSVNVTPRPELWYNIRRVTVRRETAGKERRR